MVMLQKSRAPFAKKSSGQFCLASTIWLFTQAVRRSVWSDGTQVAESLKLAAAFEVGVLKILLESTPRDK